MYRTPCHYRSIWGPSKSLGREEDSLKRCHKCNIAGFCSTRKSCQFGTFKKKHNCPSGAKRIYRLKLETNNHLSAFRKKVLGDRDVGAGISAVLFDGEGHQRDPQVFERGWILSRGSGRLPWLPCTGQLWPSTLVLEDFGFGFNAG